MGATAESMSGTCERTLPGEGATARLGAALARALGPGATVLLEGPLGAGKSALARALIRARLDEPGREVPSPSYTLINIHEGPGAEIWHADLYRLSGPEDCAELGLEDAFGRALVLVEWPDRLGDLLPAAHVRVALAMDGAEARTARLRGAGPDWESVRRALAQWR